LVNEKLTPLRLVSATGHALLHQPSKQEQPRSWFIKSPPGCGRLKPGTEAFRIQLAQGRGWMQERREALVHVMKRHLTGLGLEEEAVEQQQLAVTLQPQILLQSGKLSALTGLHPPGTEPVPKKQPSPVLQFKMNGLLEA